MGVDGMAHRVGKVRRFGISRMYRGLVVGNAGMNWGRICPKSQLGCELCRDEECMSKEEIWRRGVKSNYVGKVPARYN
jgi:hypothetical protein